MNYDQFLKSKAQLTGMYGFDPGELPSYLFDFQKYLIDWALKKGKSAIFADCGLGKSIMALNWAQKIIEKTNKNVLIVTPLAVAAQFVREGEKFGIECKRSKDGKVKSKITITNYEKLHLFDRDDFIGVVCDESSAIKNYKGERKKVVKDFMLKTPYRLLCTATAAPNDYIELGTSSEVLGELGVMDMLGRFFKNNENSLHPAFIGSKWTFKAHAELNFWQWVSSWARAIRTPSDLGFSMDGYDLPKITVNEVKVVNTNAFTGQLFPVQAIGLKEQREERKLTINDRCEKVAHLVDNYDCSVSWGHYNAECDLMEKMIDGGVQVKGSDSDEKKEETFLAFSKGEIKRLITKPKIGAFGLNWQHCNHMTFFPSHSYEQYYQGVRRIYRFGQNRPVFVDIVMSEGEERVFRNLERKSKAADKMFDQLVKHMNDAINFENKTIFTNKLNLPQWI